MFLDKILEIEEKILNSGKAMPVLAILAGAIATIVITIFLLMLHFQTPAWYHVS
jgi:hypothetical protein